MSLTPISKTKKPIPKGWYYYGKRITRIVKPRRGETSKKSFCHRGVSRKGSRGVMAMAGSTGLLCRRVGKCTSFRLASGLHKK